MRAKISAYWLALICCLLASCAQPLRRSTADNAATVVAETKDTHWDLLIFGDSDMWDAFEFYSNYYEQDLGITITVLNESRMSMPSASWLIMLREDKKLREQISKADIIAFNLPLVFPMMGGACFDSTEKLEKGCFSETVEQFASNTRDMIREIKVLVGNRGAMIRLQNGYMPMNWWLSSESLKDRTDFCMKCYERYYLSQAQVALEEGITYVDVYTAYHGSGHNLNPADAGLIGADGIHTSEKGAKLTADLYRKVGYAWWKP